MSDIYIYNVSIYMEKKKKCEQDHHFVLPLWCLTDCKCLSDCYTSLVRQQVAVEQFFDIVAEVKDASCALPLIWNYLKL